MNWPDSCTALIDTHQLARVLGVSRRTVIRLRLMGQLPPPIRIGRQLRWRPEEITQWLKSLAEEAK